IASAQFLLDGQPLGNAITSSPYSFVWDTRTVANGSHSLSARVVDIAGNTTTSSPRSITINNSVDTSPPIVSITSPHDGFSTGGTVVLNSIASDSTGVASVQYKLNGVNLGGLLTTAPYRLVWDSHATASGTYSLVAVATDITGNLTTSAPVGVTVDHNAPTV